MNYGHDDNPFGRWPKSKSPQELRFAFGLIINQMGQRVERISELLKWESGVSITPGSDDAEIDLVPDLIAQIGALDTLSEIEFAAELSKLPPQVAKTLGTVMSRDILDDNTYRMVFDAGLLWGEAFRIRYPAAVWALARPPKSSVHYGNPVVVGTDKFKTEFDPILELYGSVGLRLVGTEGDWSLSKLMKMRAFTMGYGADPRID